MAKVSEICEKELGPIIQKLGYELVEVEYAKKSDGMNLTFYIDSDFGITLDDCEKVHKAINDKLDEINPTNDGTYILNVSSLGLDRPLKTERDFKKNLGKEIEITLFSKLNGKKLFIGVLKEYDNENVVITIDKTDLSLERSKIAHIVPRLIF